MHLPYTRDQYWLTIMYSKPTSTTSRLGAALGVTACDRFNTGFSTKTKVEEAFEALISNVAAHGVPLILSYPEDGLLGDAGADLSVMLENHFHEVTIDSFAAEHSTLGASKGKKTKAATEKLYVCTQADTTERFR